MKNAGTVLTKVMQGAAKGAVKTPIALERSVFGNQIFSKMGKEFKNGFKDEVKAQVKAQIKDPFKKAVEESAKEASIGFEEGFSSSYQGGSARTIEEIKSSIDEEIERFENIKKALISGGNSVSTKARSTSPVTSIISTIGEAVVQNVPDQHKETVAMAASSIIASAGFASERSAKLSRKAGEVAGSAIGVAVRERVNSFTESKDLLMESISSKSQESIDSVTRMIDNYTSQSEHIASYGASVPYSSSFMLKKKEKNDLTK